MKTRPKTTLDEWQDVPLTNQLCRDVETAARKIGYSPIRLDRPATLHGEA